MFKMISAEDQNVLGFHASKEKMSLNHSFNDTSTASNGLIDCPKEKHRRDGNSSLIVGKNSKHEKIKMTPKFKHKVENKSVYSNRSRKFRFKNENHIVEARTSEAEEHLNRKVLSQ